MTTQHTDEKNPAQGGLGQNDCMDVLDYVEARSSKTVEVARGAYDDLHERAYKLATVLVGGGGAVGAYTLGKLAPEADPMAWGAFGCTIPKLARNCCSPYLGWRYLSRTFPREWAGKSAWLPWRPSEGWVV